MQPEISNSRVYSRVVRDAERQEAFHSTSSGNRSIKPLVRTAPCAVLTDRWSVTSANGATSELSSEVSRNFSCIACLVERKFPLENQQKWWKIRRVEKSARLELYFQIGVQSRPLVFFHFYTLLPNWNPDPRSHVPDHRFTNTDASDRPTFDRPKKGKTIGVFRSC